MARHTAVPSPPNQPARLTPEQKRDAISRLTKRLQELEAFDPNSVDGGLDPRVVALSQALDRTLVHIFGAATLDYDRYKDISQLGKVLYVGGETPIATRRKYLEEDKSKAIAVTSGIIAGFQEDLEEFGSSASGEAPSPVVAPRKVFVVHGHDAAPKAEVARFIEKLGLEAVILHERPNKGRTLITKFREEAAGVGFAVVLMTPDDLGKAEKQSDLKPRARQNVVFELGFFIGKLGPERVAALVKGDIESPSDFDGVVYISLDKEDWQTKLGRELQEAGYEIDWNELMRR
jgi:hypothetical protein